MGPVNRCAYICALLLFACVLAPHALAQYRVATVSEKTLRGWATRTVMPAFPDQSKKNGSQGVTVAQLNIDEQGSVTKVEVLEAPDELIGKAVVEAAGKWKFIPGKADSDGQPVRLKGKLTFYYVIENGQGYVRNPR